MEVCFTQHRLAFRVGSVQRHHCSQNQLKKNKLMMIDLSITTINTCQRTVRHFLTIGKIMMFPYGLNSFTKTVIYKQEAFDFDIVK